MTVRGSILYLLTVPMFTVGWVTWLLVKRREQRIERELAEANRQVEMGKQTVVAIARPLTPRTSGPAVTASACASIPTDRPRHTDWMKG